MRGNLGFLIRHCEEIKALADHLLRRQNHTMSAAIDRLFMAWRDNIPVIITGNEEFSVAANRLAEDLVRVINDRPGGKDITAFSVSDIGDIVNDVECVVVRINSGAITGFSVSTGKQLVKLVDISFKIPASSILLAELFYVMIHHLIVFRLKELVEEEDKKRLAAE